MVCASCALAQSPPPDTDKGQHHLFNPAPRELWRNLSADRPDVTESPYTVDPGAIQLEMSFVDYKYDSHNKDANTVESWAIGDATTLKFGLLHNMDIQFVASLYTEERTRPDVGPVSTLDGFSDLAIRLKINFWGNESGDTALGILPILKIPTGTSLSNGKVEAGVAVPFSWLITESLNLGLMGQLDLQYNDGSGDYDLAFLTSAVLGFDIVGPLGGYTELVGIAVTTGTSDYEASFSTGLTYAVVEARVVLDVGASFGLTRAATDFQLFTGITVRF